MSNHFISFATSNWTNAINRQNFYGKINEKLNFFQTFKLYTENDLTDEYMNKFGKFKTDYGYGLWSWKPFIIIKKLNEINYGDNLLYSDAGNFYGQTEQEIKDKFEQIGIIFNTLDLYNLKISVGEPRFLMGNCEIQIRKQMLDDFNLFNDEYFRKKYPHIETTLICMKKDDTVIDFMNKWYQYYIDKYETVIRSGRFDKNGQHSQFQLNNGDQSIMQCMLYTSGLYFHNHTSLFHDVKKRLRG